MGESRLSSLDCKTVRIFAYSSTREQSNEAENRERDWRETLFFLSPHTPVGRVRLARFERVRLLLHALPISLLILRKKKQTVLQSISSLAIMHIKYEQSRAGELGGLSFCSEIPCSTRRVL